MDNVHIEEEDLMCFSKKNSKFVLCKCEIKGNVFIQYESHEKHKSKNEHIKNRINLEDCTKFSVYCEDKSWEISDNKSNTHRFLSNSGKNDDWRNVIEKIMDIQKKGLEQKNEFSIEVDEDNSSEEICKQMIKPNSNYSLIIGEFLEIRNTTNSDSIKIDYKTHIRKYGTTKLNQLRLDLGTKFLYGEGKLFLSFVDDKTSEIVHKKIKKIADEIKVAQSPELSKKEKERVEELAKQSVIENSQKVLNAVQKINRMNSNEYKNQSSILPLPLSTLSKAPTVEESLYEDAGSVQSSNTNNNNNNNKTPTENEYKNRPIKPALPPRALKPTPQLYDQFGNLNNQQENLNSKLLNNNKPVYVHLHDKLLNSPKKVYEYKRRKESNLNRENENYEIYKYED